MHRACIQFWAQLRNYKSLIMQRTYPRVSHCQKHRLGLDQTLSLGPGGRAKVRARVRMRVSLTLNKAYRFTNCCVFTVLQSVFTPVGRSVDVPVPAHFRQEVRQPLCLVVVLGYQQPQLNRRRRPRSEPRLRVGVGVGRGLLVRLAWEVST